MKGRDTLPQKTSRTVRNDEVLVQKEALRVRGMRAISVLMLDITTHNRFSFTNFMYLRALVGEVAGILAGD